MKKINLELNYDEIRRRVEIDKAHYSVGDWAKLIGCSSSSISNIHSKKCTVKPSLEYVVAVSRVTRKPAEWYLYGCTMQESDTQCVAENRAAIQGKNMPDCMNDWPNDIIEACRQLKDILLSDHPVIKPALISSLAAFQCSLEKEKEQDEKIKKQDQEIKKLSRRLLQLENWHKAEQDTGTVGAASSSTGKSGT
jgi:hypothetical protein